MLRKLSFSLLLLLLLLLLSYLYFLLCLSIRSYAASLGAGKTTTSPILKIKLLMWAHNILYVGIFEVDLLCSKKTLPAGTKSTTIKV